MRAVQVTAPGKLELIEREPPVPAEGEALVEVLYAGVCGSDAHAYNGTQPFVVYPLVLGHELAVRVVEAPSDSVLKPGDLCAVEPLLGCGQCYPCSQGRYNCCARLQVIGVHTDGGWTETISHPAHLIHPAPEGLSPEAIALCEPLTVACHGLARGEFRPEDTVLVQGCGPIGLLAIQAAKHEGATVIASEGILARRELSLKLGADLALDPSDTDFDEKLLQVAPGGPTLVIEAAGTDGSIQTAIRVVSAAGRIVFIGLNPGSVEFHMKSIIGKELDLRGSRNSCNAFPRALELLRAGAIDTKAMITGRYPLEQAVQALQALIQRPEQVIKNLLTVTAI